jgi:GNAT superfamily N-acetyltransferase
MASGFQVPAASEVTSLSASDAAGACAVVRHSIAGCCALDHRHDAAVLGAWLANKTPENLAAWMSAPGSMAWGAYRGGAMVGCALLARATVALCYVVPEALYQGVGGALLREAEGHARQGGVTVLSLESTRTAHDFYRRNGYEEAGPVQTWAGLQAQPMRKVL